MNKLIIWLAYIFKIDVLAKKKLHIIKQANVKRLSSKYNTPICFIEQGDGSLQIDSLKISSSNFKIDSTSHLKSNTYIECSGGVIIGKYFHTGKGLTIYSVKHDYENATKIPYDEKIVFEKVVIDDFVWCGSNVTILSGVKIGEGAIIASNSTVTKDIPPLAVVGGNPAKIIKYRDQEKFYYLKENKQYY